MQKLPERILCFVTPSITKFNSNSFFEFIKYAIDGGVNMIQIRDKKAKSHELKQFSTKLYKIAGNEIIVMINSEFIPNYPNISGIHFPEKINVSKFSPLPKNKIFGQSTHSLGSAKISEENGINYLIVGSIFKSNSHPNGNISGTSIIKEIVKSTSLPVIGIGGITLENAESVIKSGANGIAVISEISRFKNPYKISKSLSEIINTN